MTTLQRLGSALKTLGTNVLERFKREPAAVRLALMGLLGALSVFNPEQLAAIDGLIDKVTPALLILLTADLRGNVTPTGTPRTTVTVPLDKPAGPSGAF